jgi:hypothetical protein
VKEMSDSTFPATVIKVLDDYNLVVNKGSRDGIKKGQRFLIYATTDELLQDPVTLEALGYLEIPKGTGKIVYLQEKWATIKSDRITAPTKKIVTKTRSNPYSATSVIGALGMSPVEVEETIEAPGKSIPFDDPSRGDKVMPI